MWVSKSKEWIASTTLLERFLTEKIIQRCDYEEVLTNQHRTTNGYTQLKELLGLCILTLTRGRTIRTVVVLFEEAKSKLFSQNIVNDTIVKDYFIDLNTFIKNYDTAKLFNKNKQPDLLEVNKLIYELKKFEIQLDKGYFFSLRKEFFSVDYKSDEKWFAKTKRITALVDILIPYLVFKGYAVSSLSEALKSWIIKKYHITYKRVFQYFNFEKRKYDYLIKLDKELSQELQSFMELLKDIPGLKISHGLVKDLKNDHEALNLFSNEQMVVLFKEDALDPHIYFRTIYDSLLKKIIQTRDRPSLATFNDFFANCYWRLPKKGKLYHNVTLVNDPININFRGKTLRDTLVYCAKDFNFSFDNHSLIPLPNDPQINSSLYYYNLALGSKSIENSLSLLWTAIEALLPYRTYYSDIECVQHFVSKSLSLGSLSRDIMGFSKRFTKTDNDNWNPFQTITYPKKLNSSNQKAVYEWYNWIIDLKEHDANYKKIMTESQLLAFEYTRIGIPLTQGKLEDLYKRINISSQSISYQTQRIYLHRNQIIHAGNLVNEYTNLWRHLEWYVGKLLAYAIIQIELTKRKTTLKEVFIELESDFDYVHSYLEKNSDMPISKISSRIKKILLNYSWQSF